MSDHTPPAAEVRGGVLVVVPTYDEATTLPTTLARLRAAVPDAHVLVVDDGSPDGTGDVADRLAHGDAAVDVLHRPGKQGLGSAYVAGFRWALDRGAAVVVEMDADGSHQPEELPRLLAALHGPAGPGLVIGSRWVPGGRVVNWPRHREVLSRAGNTYTRLALGMPVRDATAGFRAFRADVLAALPLGEVASEGYCFQVDLAWRVVRGGGVVQEVPITFVERAEGRSKMSRAIVREALVRVTLWGIERHLRAAARAVVGAAGAVGHRVGRRT
ncbi:polyprenol monophosphomannose synthase [Actinotalea sp. Marseille-Q4924]|uniref:polyprenol monophosphomannose synthase n=1 Tax=Actinotalea sp. Marseille-Q4924 TaxID=2866571 RepID=UPI001CE3C2F3|nr:polyprenol monophosphomannose synthase [Actinotalea sp. Marseille-Q4924]